MSAKATVILTSHFTDDTERKTSLGPLAISAAEVETIRARVKNINSKMEDATDTTYDKFSESWVSDDGANFQKFSAAEIQILDETAINLNN